ncbi:hypothetical protein [Streptomyces sp. NBC_00096]
MSRRAFGELTVYVVRGGGEPPGIGVERLTPQTADPATAASRPAT